MRTIIDFHVQPSLPEQLTRLKELAYNIWWSWNPEALELFRRVDENLWEKTNHNPALMLGTVSQETLGELASDTSFLEFLDRVYIDFKLYMSSENWYSHNFGETNAPVVAYFSMEFGLSECLPVYSGGLGVLSGDHLKSTSDLGIPLVGVGLLYQQGYFEQYLNIDGWQQERYPINDFYNLPIREVLDENDKEVKFTIKIVDHDVWVKIWKCEVGRVSLYLLDTNVPENSQKDQNITDQLYGGDTEMRIQQEIVLGIGGIRALAQLGIRPQVCHINEGHAAFLSLERIRLLMQEYNLPLRVARVATGSGNVFTTHTPVPAGFDLFTVELMNKYFSEYVKDLGMEMEDLLRMGRRPTGNKTDPFNMAIMAVYNATFINSVSKLHQQVTRKMIREGFSDIPENEIPISHVTNGIHLRSWISHDMAELFDRYIGSGWINYPAKKETWECVFRIPDTEMWRTHERRRERLVSFARSRLRCQLIERGVSDEQINRAEEVLDPEALTIGFARRFATYKRATLLLDDPDRLIKILTDPERPVQLIFAGKAHPHDDAGKEFIRKIVHFARDERVRDHIVFLENYNLTLGRYLVQGVDVWLNSPRRPLEASGTSGMKVAANGGINLSVLDGWWDEAYTPEVGWAIGKGEEYSDQELQDDIESNALYDLLEKDVVPLYYDRGRDGLPRKWIAKMKNSVSTLAPFFNTDRMVREYNDKFYSVARKHYERLSADGFKLAVGLADWKVHVYKHWQNVKIESVETDVYEKETLKVGEKLTVRTTVFLGELNSDDVEVEMYIGLLDENREINNGSAVPLAVSENLGDGRYCYYGECVCQATGNHGLGVRVIPSHEDLVTKYEMAIILWA